MTLIRRKRPGEPWETAAEPNGGSLPVPTMSGAGNPTGVVTPVQVGVLYFDTTNGDLYISAADPNDDIGWFHIAGHSNPDQSDPGSGAGLYTNNSGAGVAEVVGYRAGLTDPEGYQNSGNGLYWRANHGTDGTQELKVFVGADGAFTISLADPNGTLGPADGGIKFPTSDPHVAGAWWDNAGTLTKSAG